MEKIHLAKIKRKETVEVEDDIISSGEDESNSPRKEENKAENNFINKISSFINPFASLKIKSVIVTNETNNICKTTVRKKFQMTEEQKVKKDLIKQLTEQLHSKELQSTIASVDLLSKEFGDENGEGEKLRETLKSVQLLKPPSRQFEFKEDIKKIFNMFITIGIERNGLDTIDDINELMLMPKITFNFPLKKSEIELE